MIFEGQAFVSTAIRNTNYAYSSYVLLLDNYNSIIRIYNATLEAIVSFLIYLTSKILHRLLKNKIKENTDIQKYLFWEL